MNNIATAQTTNKGGRPRTGSLQFRGRTWYAVLAVEVDGETIRKWTNLHTDSKPVARRKLQRLLEQPDDSDLTEVAKAPETYAELATRVSKSRRADNVVDADGEDCRERLWILPEIGPPPVQRIKASHILAIYENVKQQGKSLSTLRNLRGILCSRFDVAIEEEIIQSSPVAKVRVPKIEVDRRERAVMTDAELFPYLAWIHPEKHRQRAVLERKTMSILARVFGGLRTNDLHQLEWTHFDVPDFTVGTALRTKTKKKQQMEVPELLRPILKAWWQATGKHTSGLVFPALRGERAGVGGKTEVSHAEAMRRDLKRAFGIEAIEPYKVERKNVRPLTLYRWKKVREPTERETELLDETDTTRPVDFHSWRRAFVQAVAGTGMNAQQARQLSGHSNLAAYQRYLESNATLTIPDGALPDLNGNVEESYDSFQPAPQSSIYLARPAGLEPATSGLEMLTRSAMNRHYLCRFVSSLVSMGTGQEWTTVDILGPVGCRSVGREANPKRVPSLLHG
jgi:integrase